MKIAIVTETFLPSTDGVVTRLCASIDWLLDEGHNVLVIAPDLGVTHYKEAKVAGIPARPFLHYRTKKYAFPSTKVGRLLYDFNPDVVHAVNPALIGAAGVFYARRQQRPLVASFHIHTPKYADYYGLSFMKPFLWSYFRLIYNRSDLCLCTSKSVMEELIGKRFRNVRLWKHGVDTNEFSPDLYDEAMRNRLTGGNPNKKLFLYVGRLTAEKEVERLRKMLDDHPDVCLALVGDGPLRKELERLFAGSETVFTGFLHGEDLAKAYASSDAFVFPSTTETLGLVVLEAMASGLPVIVSNNGPTGELVRDGETGVFFDPLETDGISKAVDRLKDEPMLRRLAVGARDFGKAHDWAVPSEQLFQFYRKVIRAANRVGTHRSAPEREKS
ncbi:MAG TPA: glycosyltransferase family 1 protein [Bacillales bacterium]|nr:glycosyltransferase family 1 protein [Bacillales bacterium]